MAARQDLEFRAGETFEIWVYAQTATGSPLAMSDVQLRVATASVVVLDMSIANGAVLTNAALGQAYLAVTPAMQATLTPGQYAYELRVLAADGTISDQAYGWFTVDVSLFSEFAAFSPTPA